MSVRCTRPLTWAELVDYWAGDVPADQVGAVDEHLMACAQCTAESMRIAAITETVRGFIPPIVTDELLAVLRRRGLTVRDNAMRPGERKEVVFPSAVDLLIHRLSGMPLDDAERVQFRLLAESTGQLLVDVHDVPFDRAAGTVLIACQKHYAAYPPDTIADIHVHDRSGRETVHRFTILHRFESP